MNQELDKLTKELVSQLTGKNVNDTQDGDYQIAYYYLKKAIITVTENSDNDVLSFYKFIQDNDKLIHSSVGYGEFWLNKFKNSK